MKLSQRTVQATLAFTVVALGLSINCSPAFGLDGHVETVEDITYTVVDQEELKIDLAKPTGDGPFPAIMAIHGGAWRAGDKAQLRDLLSRFAEGGYVAVSPQYRFCPTHTFPAQVHDVKAAVRWLRKHAEEYNVDPEKIGAVGFSAGGHLALMLGVTDADDGLEGPDADDSTSTRIQAVVNFFGPTDLTADDIPDVSVPLLTDFIGGSQEEKPAESKAASPLTYVSEDDPPILTFQGTKDPLIPTTQAIKLTEAMTNANGQGRVELLINAGHGWPDPDLERTFLLTERFFDRHLKGEGELPQFLRDE